MMVTTCSKCEMSPVGENGLLCDSCDNDAMEFCDHVVNTVTVPYDAIGVILPRPFTVNDRYGLFCRGYQLAAYQGANMMLDQIVGLYNMRHLLWAVDRWQAKLVELPVTELQPKEEA